MPNLFRHLLAETLKQVQGDVAILKTDRLPKKRLRRTETSLHLEMSFTLSYICDKR